MGQLQWIGIACVFTLIGGIAPALAVLSLSVSPTSAQPGATVTVTVSGGPQHSGDWVGIFRAGEADQQGLVDWKYLSDTKVAPLQGLTGAELHFAMPSTAGHYDFRFFWDNSWSPKLTTSSTVTVGSQLSGQRLPADASHPFIWDNDSEYDAFPLAFAMALAHNGTIRLIGISQSPHPYKRRSEDYQAIVQYARNSGWQNIPDAASDLGAYYMTALSRPGTGNVNASEIDSTIPFDTASAQMIRDHVLVVGTAAKPVVIGTGGALTTVASAYLLALRAGRGPEFAQKAIVYAGMGSLSDLTVGDYNALQDEWATYVVMQRLHVVLMQYESAAEPTFMWQYIDKLPNNEIANYLRYVKDHWVYPDRKGMIGDIQPIVALLYPQLGTYFTQMKKVKTGSWGGWPVDFDWGPDSLNWGAFKHILGLQQDSASDDLIIGGYNQAIPNSFCFSELVRAFSVSSLLILEKGE